MSKGSDDSFNPILLFGKGFNSKQFFIKLFIKEKFNL